VGVIDYPYSGLVDPRFPAKKSVSSGHYESVDRTVVDVIGARWRCPKSAKYLKII
jgi:hypothetical protein